MDIEYRLSASESLTDLELDPEEKIEFQISVRGSHRLLHLQMAAQAYMSWLNKFINSIAYLRKPKHRLFVFRRTVILFYVGCKALASNIGIRDG